MFPHFVTWFNTFGTYAKANPVMAGLFGIWSAAVITAIFIKWPAHVGRFIKHQCTTTVTMNNNQIGNGIENFSAFLTWFQNNHYVRWSRNFAVDGTYTTFGDNTGTLLGVGNGNHFFMWQGRLFWMRREMLQTTVAYGQLPSQITLTMIGRSHQKLFDLIDAFRYRPDCSRLGVFTFDRGEWNRVADIPKRGLNTVIVNAKLKQDLLDKLTWWQENRDWYETRGLPYKITFLLHGRPGTGKTTMIKGLASERGMNLCLINLARMSDDELAKALMKPPKNSIIALEDFDNSTAVKARVGMAYQPRLEKNEPAMAVVNQGLAPKQSEGINLMDGFLTLGGILNTLGGLVSLDGSVIFMTTNQLHTIDEALVRPGRVDHLVELGVLTDAEIRDYVCLMFPDFHFSSMPFVLPFQDMVGCDLEALYFRHKDDAWGFVCAIPKVNLALAVNEA